MRENTIVDATLTAAPPSTKNKEGKRDPDMLQSKKGKQWYFGMKPYIGVNTQSGLVHTVAYNPAMNGPSPPCKTLDFRGCYALVTGRLTRS